MAKQVWLVTDKQYAKMVAWEQNGKQAVTDVAERTELDLIIRSMYYDGLLTQSEMLRLLDALFGVQR